MAQSALGEVLRFIRNACAMQGTCDLTDQELLERFLSGRDESAFTFLVRRHGPLVLGVCRRILGDSHEAEDVFQATFLVLVRRTRSIRRKESVGSWLYGVAQRIGLRARAQIAARRHREREAGNMAGARPVDDLTLQELRSALDEAIGTLPEKYRTPIVLCYLEGKSHNQAAKELGWPKNSVTNRLARGRELLRRQLERRGIGLAAGALATSLAEMAAAAPMPAMLTIKTVKAAALVAAGKTVAGGYLTAGALALAEEAVTGMLLVKGKLVVMVIALGLALGGAGWAGYGGLGKKAHPALIGNAQAPVIKQQAGIPAKKDPPITADQYGDPLPEGAVARLEARRFRHDGNAEALVFSADGKSLVGSTYSGVVVWDAASGRERLRLPRSMARRQCGISPDGNTAAFFEDSPGDNETKISLWELHNGRKTRTFSFPKEKGLGMHFMGRLCFSPNGKSLAFGYATGNLGKFVVFDLASGTVRMSLGGGDAYVYSLTFSPDSKTLAAAVLPGDPNADEANHDVQLWDMATAKLIRTMHERPATDTRNQVLAMAFSPDGKMLAFSSVNRIFLFEPATGKKLGQLEEPMGGPLALAFTPDGKKLVSRGGRNAESITWSGKAHIWDVANGKILRTLDGHDRSGLIPPLLRGALALTFQTLQLDMILGGSMALAPDGKTVALGSAATAVQLWEVGTGKKLFTEYQGHDSQINALVYSPDGKTLVSAGDYEILLWDSATRQRRGNLPGSGCTLSFSPDGKQLAAIAAYINGRTTKVGIWDMAAGKEALVINVPVAGKVTWATFSPDGRKLFTLDENLNRPNWFCVRHWDVATGKEDHEWALPQKMNKPLAFSGEGELSLSPDGKKVLAGIGEGVITIYDAASGRERLLRGQEKKLVYLAPSPDGRMLATGIDRPTSTVQLWELVTGKAVFLLKGHEGTVRTIAWSPDGRLLASGDNDIWNPAVTQAIRLWDTAAGKELARFGDLKTDVTALTFSPDGTSLVAGLRDGTILVYDVAKTDPKFLPAPTPGNEKLESNWIDLAGGNVGRAHQAIGMLVAAPRQSVPFLRERLKRVARADQNMIRQWIGELESENFAVRQAAAKELAKIGQQVEPPIQEALQRKITLETRRRLEQIVKNLPEDVAGPDMVRTIRAIMALERIGSPAAQGVLATLALGAPGARETKEAKASLARLSQRASKVP